MYDSYLSHHGVKGMKWGVRKAYQKGVRKLATSKTAERVIKKSGLSDSQKKQALSERESIKKDSQKKKQAKEARKERLKKAQRQSNIAERVIREAMEKRPDWKKAFSEDDFDAFEKYETEFYRRYDNLVKMDYDKFMKRYGG